MPDPTLTRIEYLTVPVPPDFLGLSAAAIGQLPWAEAGVVADGQVLVSGTTWAGTTADTRFVIDPMQALDVVLRADPDATRTHQAGVASCLEAAGFARESVDVVLMTHIEGVGMVAWAEDGQWQPFFPNARILLSEGQLAAFQAAAPDPGNPEWAAWQALIEAGHVAPFTDEDAVLPGITAEVTDAHGPGHSVFRIGAATFIGHLAVSPAHLATGPCDALNEQPAAANERLHALADDGRLLIGPLWPAPGMGRWQPESSTFNWEPDS